MQIAIAQFNQRKIIFIIRIIGGIEEEPFRAESDLRRAEPLAQGVEEQVGDGRREPVGVAEGGEPGGHAELAAATTLGAVAGDEGIDDGAADARRDEVGEGDGIAGEDGTDRRLGGEAGGGESLEGEEATGDAWGGRGQLAPDLVAVGLEGQADDDAIAESDEQVEVPFDKGGAGLDEELAEGTVRGEDLEELTSQAEPRLGALVGIGRAAHEDAQGAEAAVAPQRRQLS